MPSVQSQTPCGPSLTFAETWHAMSAKGSTSSDSYLHPELPEERKVPCLCLSSVTPPGHLLSLSAARQRKACCRCMQKNYILMLSLHMALDQSRGLVHLVAGASTVAVGASRASCMTKQAMTRAFEGEWTCDSKCLVPGEMQQHVAPS